MTVSTVPPTAELLRAVVIEASVPFAVDSVLAMGGLARREFVQGWSDVDLIVAIGDGHVPEGLAFCARFKDQLAMQTGVDSTVVLLSRSQLDWNLKHAAGSSVLLNAYSGRPGCGEAIWGDVEFNLPPFLLERESCKSYVMDKLVDLQRLLVKGGAFTKNDLARAIRWFSSILRAGLRCRGDFRLPYEALLEPSCHVSLELRQLLGHLFALRLKWIELTEVDAEKFRPLTKEAYVLLLPHTIASVSD